MAQLCAKAETNDPKNGKFSQTNKPVIIVQGGRLCRLRPCIGCVARYVRRCCSSHCGEVYMNVMEEEQDRPYKFMKRLGKARGGI